MIAKALKAPHTKVCRLAPYSADIPECDDIHNGTVRLRSDMPTTRLYKILDALQATYKFTARCSVLQAIAMGHLLQMVKNRLKVEMGHGFFEEWLTSRKHFHGSPSTGRRYMRMAHKESLILEKLENENLTLEQVEAILIDDKEHGKPDELPAGYFDKDELMSGDDPPPKDHPKRRYWLIRTLTLDARDAFRQWEIKAMESLLSSGIVLEEVLEQVRVAARRTYGTNGRDMRPVRLDFKNLEDE